jgi:NTE family protein
VPLRVIATDLDTGDEVVFARGPLRPALLASAALPGVFPIVEHDDRRLVDGGVVNSVPLWHAFAGPVDRVIVFNVSAGAADRDERSPLDVVMTSFMHSRSQRFELEMRNVPAGVDVIVLPRPSDPRELFDFSGGRELIDEAHRLAAAELDRIAAEADERVDAGRSRKRFRRPSATETVAG